MEQLLADIQNRLATAPMAGDYAQPRKNDRLFEYVDLDWGQVDFYTGQMPPVKFPCALLDINAATYSNEGRLVQIGIVTVQVRILDLVLSNSGAMAPDGQRAKAARMFSLLSETNRLLHGFHGEGYGRLTKQGLSRMKRRDGLKEFVLTYSVQLTDSSAVPVHRRVSAAPVVQVERQ
ncbi:MAG: hypothetical protein LBH91_03085 [Prevotellaceae bacterium]|jgi:hypothetical protein|nr:hypothetical protein [Prevotellaceae bacterium]